MLLGKKLSKKYSTNEWDRMGKLYYRDVIKKITITRAKGEGNGHFYHIFIKCNVNL